jgi:hypothetical protein
MEDVYTRVSQKQVIYFKNYHMIKLELEKHTMKRIPYNRSYCTIFCFYIQSFQLIAFVFQGNSTTSFRFIIIVINFFCYV